MKINLIKILQLSLLILLINCGGNFKELKTKNNSLKIITFELTGDNPTKQPFITFTLQTLSKNKIVGWKISETSSNPQITDHGWLLEKPTNYLLTSGYGAKFVYAWVKDSKGNIAGTKPLEIIFNYGGNSSWDIYSDNLGTYDNEAKAIAVDSYDNVYVAGKERTGSLFYWKIRKYLPDGTEDTNWNKVVDSGNGSDSPEAIAIDSKNNIYIVGYGVNLLNDTSQKDWWIKKYTIDGDEDLGWNKKIHGNNADDIPNAIAIDSQDNVYLVGYKTESVHDWWIKKFSSEGVEDLNWNKEIDFGSYGDDRAFSIAIDSSDDVYVAGRYESGNLYCAIKKYNLNGIEDKTWDKKLNQNGGIEQCSDIAVDKEDNVYIIGTYFNGANIDWWIKKYSRTGTEFSEWNKIVDGGNGNDFPTSIAFDSLNNVYISGTGFNLFSDVSAEDWWIKKYNSSGVEDSSWNKKYDGNYLQTDIPYAIAIDSQDSIIVAGKVRRESTNWWILRITQ